MGNFAGFQFKNDEGIIFNISEFEAKLSEESKPDKGFRSPIKYKLEIEFSSFHYLDENDKRIAFETAIKSMIESGFFKATESAK